MAATLITGAGTLARHLITCLPGPLRTLSRSEDARDKLHKAHGSRVSVLAGCICDADRVALALRGCGTLIHAAALKRIDLCEQDPGEAVRVNVEGTRTLIQAAVAAGVERAVFVSSDKACNPSTLYGATKLVGERLWLSSNGYGKTKFTAVRYGNVWGSAGSVLHAWREQSKTGPIMLTDPTSTRFSISLQEAGALVRFALLGEPGKLFIPKLPSYRLADLATAFTCEYGLASKPVVSGLRAAEKQHEELVGFNESLQTVEAKAHYVLDPAAKPEGTRWSYSSGHNPHMLGVDKLRDMIRAYGVQG